MVKAPVEINEILKPSIDFKKEVIRSIFSIIVFIAVYFILFTLSLLLVAACIYAGVALMINLPKFLTIVVGLGLIGLGVMVFYFLVKFLFSSNKTDESDSIEITEADQPKLVAFIHRISEATNTRKPKRILLCNDVNACVFYNSNFWSMFLPVRKNLKIGLGLVNSLNISELEAVIAHEFGHFSQKSMKVGSYVYQVNKIIHDMLYNNHNYTNALQSWANMNNVFAFFGELTVQIIKGIQWVLIQMYKIVNKSYMRLSRQMEFHADLVASTVSGSNNIINALKRIELGDNCFNTTLEIYNKEWRENRVFTSLFKDQQTVTHYICFFNKMEIRDGLPVIKEQNDNISQRVVIKNQWASHPTLREREEFLKNFNLEAPVNTDPAWVAFDNREELEEVLTKVVYQNVVIDETKIVLNGEAFEKAYLHHANWVSYPEVFQGYYDDRAVEEFDPLIKDVPLHVPPFEDILSEDAIQIPKKVRMLEQDIALLTAIENKEVDVTTFDFDGVKYPIKKAPAVKEVLEQELTALQVKLKETDSLLYKFFYKRAPLAKAEELRMGFSRYFEDRKTVTAFLQEINQMMQGLHSIYSGETIPNTEIEQIIQTLKNESEPALKKGLEHWLNAGAFEKDIALKERIELFIKSDHKYFSEGSFFETELTALNERVQETWDALNAFLFMQKKHLLDIMESVHLKKEEMA